MKFFLPLVSLAIILFIADVECIRGVINKPTADTFKDIPAFETFYLTQNLDHFNFKDERTFQQRYIINDDSFDHETGPIFFYCGNEGDVESFWNNTGFMFDIAPTFRAMVVFGEHRYYGKTLPFGNNSFDLDKIGYLSVEQALADFAVLIVKLKTQYKLDDKKNPIIAFGGSYGGILAAYMRYKYPNLVQGSLAASAPIYLTAGLNASNLFFQTVTEDFSKEPNCVPLVKKAFAEMQTAFQKSDYATLSNKFKLCAPITDPAGYKHLLLWMRNAFTIMSMVDYPYPASFMGTLPAWPVHAACNLLAKEVNEGIDILTAFKDLAGILYNDTSSCFDIYALFIDCADPTSCGLGNDAKSWDYQACTELNTVQESNGQTDMFPVLQYNEQLRADYCKRVWGIDNIRTEWPIIEFWGDKIKTATNIIFSNGLLDPWHAGGVLTNISSSLVPILIKDGAHHLDLRSKNVQDPDSVTQARFLEVAEIMKWIKQAANF